jgi:hypothetical protein
VKAAKDFYVAQSGRCTDLLVISGGCLSIVEVGAGEMLCCISRRVLILERDT